MTSFDRSPTNRPDLDYEATQQIPVTLEDGSVFLVEVPITTGREVVHGGGLTNFDSLSQSINGIVKMITGPLKTVQPNKATVKLGLEIGIEQGSLVAAIVRGVGKTNVEITMEWTKEDLQKLPEA
jgi:hypothetical protein